MESHLSLAESAMVTEHGERLEAAIRSVKIAGRKVKVGESGDVEQRRVERPGLNGGRLIVIVRLFDSGGWCGCGRGCRLSGRLFSGC